MQQQSWLQLQRQADANRRAHAQREDEARQQRQAQEALAAAIRDLKLWRLARLLNAKPEYDTGYHVLFTHVPVTCRWYHGGWLLSILSMFNGILEPRREHLVDQALQDYWDYLDREDGIRPRLFRWRYGGWAFGVEDLSIQKSWLRRNMWWLAFSD
jgi:hypothetical protein